MVNWKENEIGRIPKDWSIKKIKDVSERVSVGYVGLTSKYFTVPEKGIPLLRSQNIRNGKINLDNLLFVTKEFHYANKKSILQAGDVLIVRVGENRGDTCILKQEFTEVNCANIVFFRPQKEYGKFIELFLRSATGQFILKSLTTGSAQGVINTTSIAEIFIPYPPEKEVIKISNVFEALENKIDLLNRQNATLEKMAETLFRKWFVEDAKEEWEVVTVGHFVKTNLHTITKDYKFLQIEYLDTSSLNEGKFDSTQSISLKDAPSRAKRLVNHNDILISTVRPDQRHYGIVNNPIENLVVSTGFCVINCKTINPYFIYLLLISEEMTEYLHSIAEGSTSTYPSLKPSDIEKIEFQMPPKGKIEMFGNIASSMWDKINYNYKQINTLTKLRDTLLPKLMSGYVRVEK